MAKFSAEFRRTTSTTFDVGSLVAFTTRPRRMRLKFLSFGSEAAPVDQTCHLRVSRVTAAGTSTAVVPVAIDPGDPATEQLAGENHSVACTTTANTEIISTAVHFKSTFQWHAVPGYDIVSPATAANGFGIATPVSTALQAVIAGILFED